MAIYDEAAKMLEQSKKTPKEFGCTAAGMDVDWPLGAKEPVWVNGFGKANGCWAGTNNGVAAK